MLRDAKEQISGFSIEKNGLAPKIEVAFEGDGDVVGFPAYVHFVVLEVLKNCVVALSRRYGVFYLDSCPPIRILLSVGEQNTVIRISDEAGGMSYKKVKEISNYFVSSTETEITYGYSGNFGAPLAGFGLGIPVSRLYMKMLFNGDLEICSMQGFGTDVYLTIDNFGHGLL
uniref:Protein-serine/threonine kinase n=1 Tax=Arcella intermedia TaxID=1963864 RepID=A0A6B2LGZ6_9EUKA